MPDAITVLIAEDFDSTRSGIRAHLQSEPGIEVVGEAADSIEMRRWCLELAPDVLLLDLILDKNISALENLHFVREQCPNVRVAVFTAHSHTAFVVGAVQAGARGYVLKEEDMSTLVTAIQTIHEGGTWFSPGIPPEAFAVTRSAPQFKEREIAILRMIARGMTDAEIATALDIGSRTVRYWVRGICDKLGVDRRTACIALAIEQGII